MSYQLRHAKQRLKFTPLLLVLSLMSLPSCETKPISGYCPIPVYPSKCAIDWYSTAVTPPCFDEFFDKYLRQQEAIEANCEG